MALAHQELDAPSEEALIEEVSMETEGIDFTELRRLAREHGLRAEIEFPKDAQNIPVHLSLGRTVVAQIDRFPLDRRRCYHAVVVLAFSEQSVTFLDPLATDSVPPGERTVARELFDEAHLLAVVPIVLCRLDGLTRVQAAEQLGWPPGTIATRLTRGEDLLRRRLKRRLGDRGDSGLTAWLGGLASTSVPAACHEATVQAAVTLGSRGRLAAGLVSSATALASSVHRATFWASVRSLLVVVLSLAAVTWLAAGWRYSGTGPASASPIHDQLAALAETAPVAQAPDSIFVSGVVVDAAGKPLPNVDIVLPAKRPWDGSCPTLAQGMTDANGAFRLEVTGKRFQEIPIVPAIWAYRPDRSLAVVRAVITRSGSPSAARLTLAEPLRRTLTILGPDNRPLAGVRLSPVHYEFDGPDIFQTPDNRLERLTIVSGADGTAVLPYLPARVGRLMLRVSAPGLAPHNLAVTDQHGQDRFTLKLGRPACLTGTVHNGSGQPANNVPIEVWVENSFDRPGVPREIGGAGFWSSPIHFESAPVRTRADGTFLTPPQLLTGSSYRIIIRAEDSPMVTSDWVAATTELTTVPLLRLGQHRKLIGLVHDRQGKPVAGARVFLPSGEPSATTDVQGRFTGSSLGSNRASHLHGVKSSSLGDIRGQFSP